MPRPRTSLSALLATGLLVACTAPSNPRSPAASVAPSEPGVTDLADAGAGELAPGRYTMSDFSPTVSFELDGPWFAEQRFDGFFDVQQDVGSPDVIAVQFARPSHVFGADGERVAVATAAEAATKLAQHPNLEALGKSPASIGGQEGFVIEVEHAAQGEANVSVMSVPPGPLSIAPERRLWVAFVDTSDGLLAVLVGGSVARWDEALATAEPVLESVTIDD